MQSVGEIVKKGDDYFDQEDYHHALIYYLKASQLEPSNSNYRYRLALSYEFQGFTTEAEENYKKEINFIKGIYIFSKFIWHKYKFISIKNKKEIETRIFDT
jgi:tetratricopeptide (TPR) repeat protein